MLEPLRDCVVADFYAGTGNLGIEALSRGARYVVFIDNGQEGLGLIRENLDKLKIPVSTQGPARILPLEAGKAFHSLNQEKTRFDIVIADPPYESGVLQRIQKLLVQYPLLAPGGILAVEHGSQDMELDPNFPFPLVRQKKYGDTFLSLFKSPS
jgi:16S rRNA (guanine(966)-N(2))-methyltransferase RsmD